MKKLVILAAAILGFVPIGSAAPVCVNGTLAGYISLGPGGCAIGTGATAIDQFNSIPAAAIPGPATYGLTGLGLAFALYGKSRLLTTAFKRGAR